MYKVLVKQSYLLIKHVLLLVLGNFYIGWSSFSLVCYKL
jgi:hypothetical protein